MLLGWLSTDNPSRIILTLYVNEKYAHNHLALLLILDLLTLHEAGQGYTRPGGAVIRDRP